MSTPNITASKLPDAPDRRFLNDNGELGSA